MSIKGAPGDLVSKPVNPFSSFIDPCVCKGFVKTFSRVVLPAFPATLALYTLTIMHVQQAISYV